MPASEPAPEPAGPVGDWLDGCWRCGSDDLEVSDDGRQLCAPCRRLVLGGATAPGVAVRVTGRVYWESRALEQCWRCMEESVDVGDELGLCGRCREELMDVPWEDAAEG